MKKARPDGNDNQVFLFVNKTQKSKSLSKSDGAIARSINRHAQQVRSRKVETQRLSSARTNSSSARRIALDGWHRKETAVGQSSSDGDSPPGSSSVENLQSDSPPGQLGTPNAGPSLAVTPDGNSSGESPPSSNPATLETSADAMVEQVGTHMQAAEDGESLILREPVYRINLADYDRVDPFGSTSVPITGQVQVVLEHLLKVYTYSGNNYKLAHLPPHLAAMMPRFPIRSVVQRSVYKEHHLYSLMAASTARMKHVFSISSPFSDPKQIRTIAIHHLRKELVASARSGIVDKQTILDLLYLVVNEIQYGYFDDAKRHLEIVSKLYPLLDMNEYLDRWISETAAHVDNQLALSTGSLPILPYEFDPGPMLPERMGMLKREAQRLLKFGCPSPTRLLVPRAPEGLNDAVADLAATLDPRMGSRFSFALRIGAFAGKLAKVVSDLVDCIEIAKVVWLSPLAVCFDAEWLCRKARSVLRALLKLAPENTKGPMDLYSKCTENARICLMILLTHACTMIGHQTARSNVKRLQQSSRAALEYWCPSIGWTFECQPHEHAKRLPMFQDTQAGFVLWAMFTGIWCAEGVAEEDWFMVRAVNICRYFGYYTYDDLHDHMAHYLYAKTLQEPSLRKTARLLQTLPRGYA